MIRKSLPWQIGQRIDAYFWVWWLLRAPQRRFAMYDIRLIGLSDHDFRTYLAFDWYRWNGQPPFQVFIRVPSFLRRWGMADG